MAVPRLDPRINADRLVQYPEYQVLRAQFGKRRRDPWYSFLPWISRSGAAPRMAVRMLPFKLALGAGLSIAVFGFAAMMFLQADTTRLEYAKQDYSAALTRLDQAKNEAVENNAGIESSVLSGEGVSPAEVVYPAAVEYVVLTNIPDAEGKILVEDLYPLSKKIIRVEP